MDKTNNEKNRSVSPALKHKILSARDLKREEVFVDEWDVTIYITEMSGAEKTDYQTIGVAHNSDGEIMLGPDGVTPVVNKDAFGLFQEALLVRTIVDENGDRLFTNEEIGELKTKSATVLERLHDISARLNRTRPDDIKALEKN